MKLKKFATGVFAMAAVAAALIFTGGTSVTAKAAVNTKSDIEIATRLHNYSRSASPIGSYLVDIGNGNMMRVQSDYDSSNIYVEYYDSQYNVTGVRQLAPELPIYGGFYSGGDAYYIVTGQKNEEESDTVECYRITKYDKNWNRIGSAGLYDCNTFLPFRAGCVRMTEADGYLFVRTSHQMYLSSDGLRHQANVTIQFDENKLVITDSYTDVMNSKYGYVSHSFNQFIKTEGNHLVAVDHGDAYPRSIVLTEYQTDFTNGQFISNMNYWKNPCKSTDLFEFTGEIGDNATGASVGGFEVTDSAYLVAANSINQEDTSDDRSRHDYRNVCIVGKSKRDGHTFVNWLTNLEGDLSATTPYLVKINDNKYLVMWSYQKRSVGAIDYTYIDADGSQISPVYTMNGMLSDCEPVYINDTVVWYTSDSDGNVTFYGVDSNGNALGSLNGLIYDGDNWVYYRNDNPDYGYTGLAANEYGWWYVSNGTIDFDYTGLAANEYGWWYVSNGTIDFSYTGMAANDYGWWYVSNGAIDFNYTGMAVNDYGWWYMTNGALDWNYTGMAVNDYGWWYMTNGALDWNYTGMAVNDYGWWYMTNGALDWNYTGMAVNDYGWWYMTNGALDWNYTGMAVNDYGWWYMTNGALDRNYTGLAVNEYGWWYMTNGALDLTYNGTADNEYGTWNVVNGHVEV
ncbi:MAG: hypothetical protein U0H95_03640 [Lachnospira sp.]|nr:hypothetical protein [Lachnospira sp.]